MTALILAGQLEPVRPRAVRSWFMRAGEGDLSALKTISDAFPVPAGVGPGTGTIGSQRAVLTDDQVERCVRDWVWRAINFTGTDSGGSVPTTHRAIDLYNWVTGNAALNGGLGPTMSCGTIASLYVGFLAVYGIPARRIWAHAGTGHNGVDFSAEYWSPSVPGWVHVIPYLNGRSQWTATGRSASLLDEITVARQLGDRHGVIDTVYDGASTGAAFRSGALVDLYAYFDWCIWGRGDRVQFAGGITGDPLAAVQGNQATNLLSLLPQTANVNAPQVAAITPFVTVARDLTDVEWTPSALTAYLRATASGLAEVALESLMLDTSPTYQVMPPGGAWTALATPAHAFYPVPGQTWAYRVVGPRGNTSNTVTVTVTA